MKRALYAVMIMVLAIGLVTAALAGAKSKIELKSGDEVYACNCGEKCPCQTMSRNAGNCTCGKEMVKATVVKTEGNTALLKSAGWEKERLFTTTAKYACACGESCKCDTISQNPGKCTCGAEMEKVK